MGKFDGILLASDWDGTLIFDGKVNDYNIEKIKYFCKEGGKFTVCTGRSLSYISQFFNLIKPNTYCITLNGAVVAHPNTKEKLYLGHLGDKLTQIIDSLYVEHNFFSDMHVYFDGQDIQTPLTKSDYIELRSKFTKGNVHKILFIAKDVNNVRMAKALTNNPEYSEYLFVSSWETSLEVIDKKSAKGYSLLRLKEHIGAKTLVTVGDYENDVQMLEMADISYAVDNAPDCVKQSAKRQTVHAKYGAIGHVIDELERELS